MTIGLCIEVYIPDILADSMTVIDFDSYSEMMVFQRVEQHPERQWDGT